MVVRAELRKMGFNDLCIDLGMAEISEDISYEEQEALKSILLEFDLELLDNKKANLINKIKNVIIEMVHYSDSPSLIKNFDYINEKLHYDYTYLANVFH